mmetsp:Transcript_32972/g.97648  ORF Transcript_32972/g.97648 Transcript_32972/m.97648 type:complete len:511 (-) Transcript_32972:283-1815(-)
MIAPAPKFALRRMGGAAMSHPSASTSESIASTSAARYTGLRFPSPPFAPMPPALKSTPVREVSSRAAVPAPYPTHVWPAPPFSPGTIVSDSSAGAARPRVRYAGERAARCGAAESNHACCRMAAGERRSAWSMASMPSRRLSASSVRRCCLPYHCSTVETVHLPSYGTCRRHVVDVSWTRRRGALAVLLRALELVVPPVRVRRLLEREEAEQHRKEGDAARPHVGTKGVPRLGEHLRRAVGARAAAMVEHLHLVRGRGAVCALAERLVLVREPKVDHAEGEVGGEHEVLELEVAVQHAAGVHVVQSAAQRGQEGDQLSLEQRQLAAATRHAVDQVPACAVLHRDADGDASRLVPVEKDVLEADDAWVGEALQARRLQQRLVRVVDRGAADLLEDDGLAVAQRQGGLAEAALAEGAPLLDAPLAPVAFARLLLWGAAARALPERATKRDAADDEGAARHVEGHHCSLAHFNRHDPPRLVMSHKKVARRGARDLDRGRRRRRRGRHRRVRRE